MPKVKYVDLEFYDDYIESLKRRKCDFSVSKTTYSKKIKENYFTTVFNDGGREDFDILPLINLVRADALKFIEKYQFKEDDSYISFYDFFNMPNSDEVICKIDTKSAYWEMARKKGVITEKTNNKLLELFEGRPVKEMKSARLKALGSLATQKTKQWYVEGKMVKEECTVEITRPLYMDICRDVDKLMAGCVRENQDIIYYYWDCIFAPKNIAPQVINYFEKVDYDVTVEETKLTYVDIFNDGGGYIVSESDNKAYMVRKESIGLLKSILQIEDKY